MVREEPQDPGIDARITSPADGDTVGYPIILTGHLDGELGDLELYAVVKQERGGAYKPVKDPCDITADTDIRCAEIYLGAPEAHDVGFDLLLVSADQAAQQAFTEYAHRPPETGHPGFDQLPAGTYIADQVTVERE